MSIRRTALLCGDAIRAYFGRKTKNRIVPRDPIMELPPGRLFAAFFILLAVPILAVASDSEDGKLADFFKAYLEKKFHDQPMQATRLGDHRFDHQLDNVSPAARAAWAQRDRATLAELPRAVDYKNLSRSGQIDFEILSHDLSFSLWSYENERPFAIDPRVYNGYITDCTYLLLAQSTVPKREAVGSCAARMRFIPRIVEAAKLGLKNPACVMVETAIRQNKGAINYYETGIFELAGETPQLSEMAPAAANVVASLKDYQHFLETTLLPRATETWRIGKEKFARKIELELNAGLTADEVLAEAEKEAERVERELYVIARQLWGTAFPRKPLPPDDAEGRRAAITAVLAHFNKEHGKAEDLIRDARETV
ncbi:MAG: DUF885 family protein, partial [Candidatus Acidiferrum sp.]